MFINDILKVIYAPHKVFKSIVANPKYLGVLIVILLFIGLQIGFAYTQFSRTYTEQTNPVVGVLPVFTNATYWQSSSPAALSNNFNDYFNYTVFVDQFQLPPTNPNAYFSVFGNSSLEMSSANTNNITSTLDINAALSSLPSPYNSTLDVDCSASGFQNLSITMKLVAPQTVPQSATLTLYSLSNSNYYQYDLTPQLSSVSIGQWNNLTIPVGPNAVGWTPSGNPTWSNITSLKLGFTYSSSSNVTVHVGALFFRGQYLTPIQYNSEGIILQFLERFSLQLIFSWFVLTGIIYIICKGLKSSVLWKPLFIALGFAMFIMVIRGAVNLAAALTLPTVYYPYDVSLGLGLHPFAELYYPGEAIGTLSLQSQAIVSNIDSATSAFRTIVEAMFVVSYVWLGGVVAMVIGALKPEFSILKRLAFSAIGLAVVILAVLFLVGLV